MDVTLTLWDAQRVLVVDDDPSFATFVCSAIEKLGVQADVSPTGSDAVNRLERGRWLGVLLDLNLPDGHGLDVLRKLRSSGDQVPVFVVTGTGSIQSAVEATKLGAVNFLEKPIRLPALVDSINYMVAWSRSSSDSKIQAQYRHGPLRAASLKRHATEAVVRDLAPVLWSQTDPSTVPRWADLLGVSPSVLHTRCDLARMRTKACLDLGRVVRARILLGTGNFPLPDIFSSRDERTIVALLRRGGLAESDLRQLSISQLLAKQRFVQQDHFVDALSKGLINQP